MSGRIAGDHPCISLCKAHENAMLSHGRFAAVACCRHASSSGILLAKLPR